MVGKSSATYYGLISASLGGTVAAIMLALRFSAYCHSYWGGVVLLTVFGIAYARCFRFIRPIHGSEYSALLIGFPLAIVMIGLIYAAASGEAPNISG
jgi:hypothetical protein